MRLSYLKIMFSSQIGICGIARLVIGRGMVCVRLVLPVSMLLMMPVLLPFTNYVIAGWPRFVRIMIFRR